MKKYSINDTTLAAIAGPVMTLRGLTGGLTPEDMAVQAGIVAGNVAAALAKIAEKGVAVADTANSDDLAELIDAIAGTEDLSAELAAQDALIDQLETLVAQKAAGGDGTPPNIQPLTVSANGTYTASGDVDGYSPVTVQIPETEPALETLTVTKNGTYTPSGNADGFSKVTVNVPTSGGSGSIETCTLTVKHTEAADGAWSVNAIAYTTVQDGEVVGIVNDDFDLGTHELTCVKGSIVTFLPYPEATLICSGNAVEKLNWVSAYIIEVNGDATVTMS